MFLDLIAVGTHKAKLALVALENLSRTAHRISCACPVPSTAPSGCHQAWQFPTAAQHGEPELLRGLWWSVYGWGGGRPSVRVSHFITSAQRRHSLDLSLTVAFIKIDLSAASCNGSLSSVRLSFQSWETHSLLLCAPGFSCPHGCLFSKICLFQSKPPTTLDMNSCKEMGIPR